MKSKKHPSDEGAEEYYEETYGKLFRECPGLKGVTLVGESTGLPYSTEPDIDQIMRDGVPTGKNSPGNYPCMDYVDLLQMMKKVIRKYKPDADIVFWTYNFGKIDARARTRLIEALPTDITLLATFEMFEQLSCGSSVITSADYSLSFAGPGYYFRTEAEAAKKRGIRMYSMTNSGGRTWDFGCAPYEPMPDSWIRRYDAMKQIDRKSVV